MKTKLILISALCAVSSFAADLNNAQVAALKDSFRNHAMNSDTLSQMFKGTPAELNFKTRASAYREALAAIEMAESAAVGVDVSDLPPPVSSAPVQVIAPPAPAPKPSTTIKWRATR